LKLSISINTSLQARSIILFPIFIQESPNLSTLPGQKHSKTTIVYEYPTGEGDPYYPIPRKENQEIYNQYKKLADETPDVYFTGRLGTYKYYNMDQVVAQSLALFRKIIKESENDRQ
jgi:UDP-galactopyranose mutase